MRSLTASLASDERAFSVYSVNSSIVISSVSGTELRITGEKLLKRTASVAMTKRATVESLFMIDFVIVSTAFRFVVVSVL